MAVTTQSFGAAFRRLAGVALVMAAVLAVMEPTGIARHAQAGSDTALTTGSVSGLPVPRFVSLKSDRVNVRAGPTKDQDVRWVYTRAGMPVEITAEFENWRRIRDWEGAEGWVYHSLLSGKRSAVVVPTLKADLVPLYEQPDTASAGNCPPAIRRARPAQILQRQLVPIRRQEFRRLDPPGPAVGRLSEREGGLAYSVISSRPARKSTLALRITDRILGFVASQLFRFSRTTTSTRSIS